MSLALFSVWAVALASPGPDVLMILRNAARSRSLALITASGVVMGIVIWITLAQIGVAALLSSRPSVRVVFQLVGGAFLLLFGVRALASDLRQRRDLATEAATIGAPAKVGRKQGFATGLTTNIANPKALVFFGALFVQFSPTNMPWSQRLAMSLIMIVMAIGWFLTVALLASHPVVFSRLSKNVYVVDVAAAIIFSVLGISLLVDSFIAL